MTLVGHLGLCFVLVGWCDQVLMQCLTNVATL
jgi:hypothetical protein